MNSLLVQWFPTFATVTSVVVAILLGQSKSKSWLRTHWSGNFGNNVFLDKSTEIKIESTHRKWAAQKKESDDENLDELKSIKQLYYQLHNLEKFPEVLPRAKRLLVSLLEETSTAGRALPLHDTILSVESFSRHGLEEFQHRRDRRIGKEWEDYNVRRKEGSPRELVSDREEAIWWLKQLSPVKYVDGAWLGYIGKVTTPFALWKTMKGAWQILSEELGDGDLRKNHVHLYHKLLETTAPDLPTAESLDYGHPRHQLNELSVWKSAIAQLLISLFPHEFLPEIIGFNLHFESISIDTLKATRELKEVGLDPYYFLLHISIDNTHSGHSAIAIEVVCEYMNHILKSEGEEAARKAWGKLQAGFLLSSCLPGTVICPSHKKAGNSSNVPLNPTEIKVINIFRAKAQVAHGFHCSSRVKIGSRSVADWLDPVALESKEWQKGLIDALSSSKYWICKGDSSKSRFIQELQWNGRMFGSFTQDEYNVLTEWIDALPNKSSILRALDSDGHEDVPGDSDDILSGYPVFQQSFSSSSFGIPKSFQPATTPFTFQTLPSLDIGERPVIERLLPLWISHPCLLQTLVSVPIRTKNSFACTVVKILRAQGGFDIERECPAGMDEVQRDNSFGLAGIGLNMMVQQKLSPTALPSLKEILKIFPSDFAVQMLHVSMRPMAYKGMLIGMATAFAKMHSVLSKSQSGLLSIQDQDILQRIAHRELEGLELCWRELENDEKAYADCCGGYVWAASEIKKCFQSGPVSGHAGSIESKVSAYLGIPYAQPPVGKLRFMPPEKYHGDKPISGKSVGDACPANTPFAARGNDLNKYDMALANLTAQGIATLSDLFQVKATFSEDCLNLNVWVPTGGEDLKAVMIYIYGGSYTGGSTQIGYYDGQHLAAEQDVIVVNFNYRVDILGFHGDPESENHNPGFLDQRLAVEWVRDNIRAFGGDPARLTLFGQSAGSASVDHYGYSYASDPIVSGFIMESGAAGFGRPLPLNNAEAWYSVSSTLGCGTNDTASYPDMLSCLQKKDFKELFAAIGSNSFGPSVDGITGFDDYPALSKAGKFAQLPLLTGNNDFETGAYIPLLALNGVTHDHEYWVNYGNSEFACPAGARANVSASHNLPIWRYRWFGNFPNTRLYTNPDSGAWHCSEIAFIWNTLPSGPDIPADTEAEVSIREYVQGAWAAFAKAPYTGLKEYRGGWPQYSPYRPSLIRLAYNNVTGTNVASSGIYDETCLTTYPVANKCCS
ncbi:hypothetical protein V494_07825 [Pseudogymnoascus sp. VKM F-4513 (FW-928)]|nr:hypothetical protein V494_07825 [Pseudogymnoascus sp. VKM F-4513 (FW-928)]